MPERPRTWPPARLPEIDPNRPDYRAARRSARNLMEGWAVELAAEKKRAAEYREHLVALVAELRELQRAAAVPEHGCAICSRATAAAATEAADPSPRADPEDPARP